MPWFAWSWVNTPENKLPGLDWDQLWIFLNGWSESSWADNVMLSSVLCLINLVVMLPGALVGCGTRNLSEGVQGASEFLSLCGISWKQDCFRRFWGKCPFLGHIFLSHRKVSFFLCWEISNWLLQIVCWQPSCLGMPQGTRGLHTTQRL